MLAIALTVHGAGSEDRTPTSCLEDKHAHQYAKPAFQIGGRPETRSPHLSVPHP